MNSNNNIISYFNCISDFYLSMKQLSNQKDKRVQNIIRLSIKLSNIY